MDFIVKGLDPAPFRPLYGLTDAELAERGVLRMRVDACPGFPDRVEMRDMALGEWALLLNHEYMQLASPYRGRHAIFVREGAATAHAAENEVPEVMTRRQIALRGFDAAGMMRDAGLATGPAIAPLIERLFADPEIAFIHAHNAARGCYSGLIVRA